MWASQFVGWSNDDWRTIIWLDEVYICLGDVSRTGNKDLYDGHTILTFKQSSIRIMVWGCMMADRKGPLRVLEYPGGMGGGMTSERYQDQVLHSTLYDFYWEETEKQGFVAFQQNGARCHTSKSTQQWFQDNHIKNFPHSASSPNLNLIKPIWHTLKQIIRA